MAVFRAAVRSLCGPYFHFGKTWNRWSKFKSGNRHPDRCSRSDGLGNGISYPCSQRNFFDWKKKLDFSPEKRIGYEIYKHALDKGLVLRPLDNVLYFNPALNITRDELDIALALAKTSIEEILPR